MSVPVWAATDENIPSDPCIQWRLGSACASLQFDQSLHSAQLQKKVWIFFWFLHEEVLLSIHMEKYSKCPKIWYTKVSDKMAYANSVDLDQTAPSGAVWSGSSLFAIPLSIFGNNCIKSKIWATKV